jgi:hypothetical protein
MLWISCALFTLESTIHRSLQMFQSEVAPTSVLMTFQTDLALPKISFPNVPLCGGIKQKVID